MIGAIYVNTKIDLGAKVRDTSSGGGGCDIEASRSDRSSDNITAPVCTSLYEHMFVCTHWRISRVKRKVSGPQNNLG